MENSMSEIYFYKIRQKELYESIHADLGGTAECLCYSLSHKGVQL